MPSLAGGKAGLMSLPMPPAENGIHVGTATREGRDGVVAVAVVAAVASW